MYKSERLVEFVKEKTKIKSAYMWGDYGRTITESTISQKARQYPSRYPAARQELLRSYIGKGYAGRLRRSLQMVFVDRRRDEKRDNVQFGDG